VPWGRLLFQVLNLRIPADALPADEEERERSEWWKAKKWACGILGRLFHRYGVYYRSHLASQTEGQLLMSIQVRQSFSAAQPAARRIRVVCRSLCESICARDLQGVSPSDRIIRLGTGVAVQEVPVPDSPVLHRVVRAISFIRLNHDAMKM